MARINEPGSGHGRFTSASDTRYWEYTSADALAMLKKAVWIIENSVKGMRPCNDCFRLLPGKRSFDEVWNDASVWINYDPRADRGWYGRTYGVGGKEICISEVAFKKGRWWVAGTLVHELAHVNGAPINTAAADETLLKCGLKNAYEGVIGTLDSRSADYLV
jgi:hypothetical protein